MLQKSSLSAQQSFWGIALLTLVSSVAAILLETPALYALPLVLLVAAWVLTDIRPAYWLLLALIPLSKETLFSSQWALDLPQEPLLIVISTAVFLYALVKERWVDSRFIRHPIIQFLALHWFWILLAAIFSASAFVSFKFWIAKTWYLSVFVVLTGVMVRNLKDAKHWVWLLCTPLFFIIIRALILHAQTGFAFLEIGKCVIPFFRNHVNYGVMLSVLLPYLIFLRCMYKDGSKMKLLVDIGILLFTLGIVFAYSRAAYASLLLVPVIIFIFRARLSAVLLTSSILGLILGCMILLTDNNFLQFAPDNEHTIQHETLSKHFNATLEGTDMSFMERIYRWVAAMNMTQERPFIGFGPNNFYNFYQKYAMAVFETYVSDNPERSGVHNYFLMTLVEQGSIGLIIFLAFIVCLFTKGEQIYHKLQNTQEKVLALAILTSISITMVNCLVGDLLETDEIGSIFFMGVAMLVNLDLYGTQ